MRQPESDLTGPDRATLEDIEAINRLFADAFTDRYHRDGMTGVRVPFLNPLVWRYAIEDAGEGALVWRDGDGRLAAFNMVHQSGIEGWMGPLAVRPALQGMGVGTLIVREGISLLTRRGATVIGLETMPRTVENIGFYSGLGFRPGHLTVSMVKDLEGGEAVPGASRLPAGGPARAASLEACRAFAARVLPGVDYTRELALTEDLSIGGTSLVSAGGRLRAFALWHHAAMAQGRPSDEVRIRKLVAADLDGFGAAVGAVEREAAGVPGVIRVSVRCQTRFAEAYARLLESGYRVHWTDLRMELWQGAEPPAPDGIVLSNWEI
jgi:ribosomal protein S18 acetylase RimI-like enzyme